MTCCHYEDLRHEPGPVTCTHVATCVCINNNITHASKRARGPAGQVVMFIIITTYAVLLNLDVVLIDCFYVH